jgi:hypothetical protein
MVGDIFDDAYEPRLGINVVWFAASEEAVKYC